MSFIDPDTVRAHFEAETTYDDPEVEIPVTATRLRGEVRVGYPVKGLGLPEELQLELTERVRERIDGRKITTHTELGTVVVNRETGEITSQLDTDYLRPTEQ